MVSKMVGCCDTLDHSMSSMTTDLSSLGTHFNNSFDVPVSCPNQPLHITPKATVSSKQFTNRLDTCYTPSSTSTAHKQNPKQCLLQNVPLPQPCTPPAAPPANRRIDYLPDLSHSAMICSLTYHMSAIYLPLLDHNRHLSTSVY